MWKEKEKKRSKKERTEERPTRGEKIGLEVHQGNEMTFYKRSFDANEATSFLQQKASVFTSTHVWSKWTLLPNKEVKHAENTKDENGMTNEPRLSSSIFSQHEIVVKFRGIKKGFNLRRGSIFSIKGLSLLSLPLGEWHGPKERNFSALDIETTTSSYFRLLLGVAQQIMRTNGTRSLSWRQNLLQSARRKE